jgi:hypothetical protein
VIRIVRDGGHVDAALDEARDRLELADNALAGLPRGLPWEIMETLGRFLLNRVQAARA